jgi:hypothetical protein
VCVSTKYGWKERVIDRLLSGGESEENKKATWENLKNILTN